MEGNEVGVGDVGEDAELVLEAVESPHAAAEHHFQSDERFALVVEGSEDDSHAPVTEFAQDLVAAQQRARECRGQFG